MARLKQYIHFIFRLFQTLSLWLDEPRLHDPALFIQGLPSIYDSERLARILEHDEVMYGLQGIRKTYMDTMSIT